MGSVSHTGKDRQGARRRRLRLLLGLTVVWFVALVAGASAYTIVSLSFDDGLSSARLAGKILGAHGLHASFFVITGDVGQPGHASWEEIKELAEEGHEIGSHTVHHADLATKTPEVQEEELCESRKTLNEHGYPALTFAYPHGEFNAETLRLLPKCGYTSARLFGEWQGGSGGAESDGGAGVYPEPFSMEFEGKPNPYELSVLGTSEAAVPLEYLEKSVEWGLTGWVIIAVHGVCNYTPEHEGEPSECEKQTPTCTVETAECTPSTYGPVSPADLEAFASWLNQQPNLVVRTIGQVANDKTPPTTTIACNGAPCANGTYTEPVSISLPAVDAESMLEMTAYTTDGSEPTTSSTPYTGEPFTLTKTTTIEYRSWDVRGNEEPVRTQTIKVDTDPPHTTIESKPLADSNNVDADFSFTANEQAMFECSLDGGSFENCTSPHAVSGLANGSHTFEVRSTDLLGTLEASPPSYTWTVDTTPPVTTIESEPLGETIVTGASIAFSANEPATFECSLDGGGYAPCSSPYVASGLGVGAHELRVKATDILGNVEPEPAVYRWTVVASSDSASRVIGGGGAGAGLTIGPFSSAPHLVLARRAGREVLHDGLPVGLYCSGPCSATIVVEAPVATVSPRKRRVHKSALAAVHRSASRAGTLDLRIELTRRRGASISGGRSRTVPLVVVAAVRTAGGEMYKLRGVVTLRARLGSLPWV
jgi:peptidoglycan/xylan/chitin deacetylase (PgdA/CDA1 family)